MFIFYSDQNDLPVGSTSDLFNVNDPAQGEILSYDGSHFTNTNILSGSNIDLINIDASNITSGTLNYARLPILYFSGTESVAPYVETISPAITSSGLQNITITGDNFTPNTTVTIPGATITNLVCCSPQKITFTISKTNLSGLITITINNGVNTNQIWDEGIKNITVNIDPFATSVILFIKGDGTNNSTNIIDNSITPKILTIAGSTKISTDQSKYGGSSIYFDGIGSLTLSNDSAFLLDANFTIECWFFTASTGEKSLFSYDSASGLYFNNSSFTWWKDGIGSILPSHSISINTNQWHHVAVCKSANSLSLYFNGNFIVAGSLASSVDLRLKAIALRPYSPNFHGYIDSFRVTKGIARYLNSFNPETDTYLNI